LTQWQLDYHPITRLRSNGGPAFKSAEFVEFCGEFGITHEMSSVYNPESDGMAEAGVNVCKRLQKKSMEDGTNFRANLQSLNNFPRKAPAGMPPIASPAEMFFSTGQRDYNPRLGSNEPDMAMSAMSREKQRAIMRENSHRKNTAMMPLIRNDLVWIQDPKTRLWDQRGKVVAVRPSGRSFLVMKENSKISRRNRKFLKLREASPDDADIDLECARITVVGNRYSGSTPRRRESCLLRRPTEREMQTRSPGTGPARRVSFSTATTIKAVSVGGDGRDLSLSETIAFASKVVHRINFGPVTGG
jgi:transposase InsO family protein